MLPTPADFSVGNSRLSNFSMPPTFVSGPSFAPTNQPGFLSDPLNQATDPNSPDVFKTNTLVIQQQVLELQAFSRRVLLAIQNAYQTGNSPAHTEADIATLKQMLAHVIEKLRTSGVGALPVRPHDVAILPTEQQLYEGTNRNLQLLYDKLQKSHNSAAVVANLLVTDHGQSRTGK